MKKEKIRRYSVADNNILLINICVVSTLNRLDIAWLSDIPSKKSPMLQMGNLIKDCAVITFKSLNGSKKQQNNVMSNIKMYL